MNILKLECPNCLNIRTWDRDLDKSPGSCFCKTKQYWKVLSKEEAKKRVKLSSKGFVRLLKDNGYHNLKGPSYHATESNFVHYPITYKTFKFNVKPFLIKFNPKKSFLKYYFNVESFKNHINALDWYKGPFTKSRIAELRKKLAAARGMLLESISTDHDEKLIADVKAVLTETADL